MGQGTAKHARSEGIQSIRHGNRLSIMSPGFVMVLQCEKSIPQISERSRLSTNITHLSVDLQSLTHFPNRQFNLPLSQIIQPQIAQTNTLGTTVPNVAMNLNGLMVMFDGSFVLTHDLIDGAQVSDGIGF